MTKTVTIILQLKKDLFFPKQIYINFYFVLDIPEGYRRNQKSPRKEHRPLKTWNFSFLWYFLPFWQCCGSGSTSGYGSVGSIVSHKYGSGSFHHQAKIKRKTLISTVLRLFITFDLWRMMYLYQNATEPQHCFLDPDPYPHTRLNLIRKDRNTSCVPNLNTFDKQGFGFKNLMIYYISRYGFKRKHVCVILMQNRPCCHENWTIRFHDLAVIWSNVTILTVASTSTQTIRRWQNR